MDGIKYHKLMIDIYLFYKSKSYTNINIIQQVSSLPSSSKAKEMQQQLQQQQQQQRSEQSDTGSGFLITCDKNKEKQAIKDAFNFLTEYIEDIYGDIETQIIHKELDKLAKEHNLENQMQIRSKMKNKLKLLSSPDTNVNCLIFIKINENITKISPCRVVSAIMKDVHENQRELTRFCHKILPVQKSFKAEHFKMLDQIDNIFQTRDNSQIKSWALNFKCRNNSKFQYKEVLVKTEQIVKKYGHFVDIYYPQLTVCVEIVHHLMCLAVVEGYKQYDQFRLHKKGKPINNHNNNNNSGNGNENANIGVRSEKVQRIKEKIQQKQKQKEREREKQREKEQDRVKQQPKQEQLQQQQQHKSQQKQKQIPTPTPTPTPTINQECKQQRNQIHCKKENQPQNQADQNINTKNKEEPDQKINNLLQERIMAKDDDEDDNII